MQLGRVAPVLVLVVGLVAGCTSGGTPPRSPGPAPSTASSSSATSSSATSPSPSPSPSVPTTGPNVRPGEKPPTLAPNGSSKSRPGAADFAYFWFQALDWGYATTSSVLARSLFLPSCQDCARFMGNFDDPRMAGKHYQGGRSTILRRHIVSGDNRHPGASAVDVTLRVSALNTLDARNKVVDRGRAIPKITYRVWLKWTDNGWRVLDFKQVVSS